MKTHLLSAAVLLLTSSALMAQPKGAPADMFMKHFDTNSDGGVSKEEFISPQMKQLEMEFAKMDTNGDGTISKAEAEAFVKAMEQHMMQMRQQQAPKQ